MTPLTAPAGIPAAPHLTIAVLKDGTVHAIGSLCAPGGTWSTEQDGWIPAQTTAARLDRPVRVSVGRAEGQVTSYLVHPDGELEEIPSRTRSKSQPPDPRWTDGTLDRHPLTEPLRAAQRAANWPVAQTAVTRLADDIRAEHNDQHPYTILAAELEGLIALHARDWPTAARRYTLAAETRHNLSAPPMGTRLALGNALAAWLQASAEPGMLEHGYSLVHFLIRATPYDTRAIATVQRQLAYVLQLHSVPAGADR